MARTTWALLFVTGAALGEAGGVDEKDVVAAALRHRSQVVERYWGVFASRYYPGDAETASAKAPAWLRLIGCWANPDGWREDVWQAIPPRHPTCPFGPQDRQVTTSDGVVARRWQVGSTNGAVLPNRPSCFVSDEVDLGPWGGAMRWSAGLLRDGFTLVGQERLGDTECRLVETKRAGQGWRVWLAPAFGWAPVQAVSTEVTPSMVAAGLRSSRWQVYWEDFREVSPGVWWPHRIRDLPRSGVGLQPDKWVRLLVFETLAVTVNGDDRSLPFQCPALVGISVTDPRQPGGDAASRATEKLVDTFPEQPAPWMLTDSWRRR